jgi:hypothetical protein
MSQVGRRDPDSIDEVFGEDHQRLDGILERLRSAIRSGSPQALEALEELSRGLKAHMTWEEERLFPAVRGRATAAQKRSLESLEIDHERLRDTLGSLHSSLSGRDFGTAGTQLEWLETLLRGHNYDEEHGVYVEADRSLSVEERRELIARFREGRS